MKTWKLINYLLASKVLTVSKFFLPYLFWIKHLWLYRGVGFWTRIFDIVRWLWLSRPLGMFFLKMDWVYDSPPSPILNCQNPCQFSLFSHLLTFEMKENRNDKAFGNVHNSLYPLMYTSWESWKCFRNYFHFIIFIELAK